MEKFQMTQREALEKTIKMWDWMAEHPGMDKLDYFLEEDILPIPHNACYLCEEIDARGCENCPLYGRWGSSHLEAATCLSASSLYSLWGQASRPGAEIRYAKAIAARCREILAEMETKRQSAMLGGR